MNLKKWLNSYVRMGAPALATLLLVALPSSGHAQTFDQAVLTNCAAFTLVCSPGTIVSSSGWPTALTRETSPVEERKVQRLVGSLSVFLTGEYEHFDKNLTTFEPAYKTNTGRVTIGGDYAFNDHRLVVGGAFTYTNINGNFNSGGRLETGSYSPLLYVSFVPAPKFFVDAAAGYGRQNYFLSRTIFQNGSVLGTAAGNTDGNVFNIGVNSGYDFNFQSITVGPRFGLDYKRTEIAGYRERGDTVLNLIYNRQTENSLTSVLGLYGSIAISTSFGVLVPQTIVKYVHEFEDPQRRINFRFVDNPAAGPFSFQNDPPDRNYFDLGVGIVAVLPHELQPFINYRALLGYNNQSSHIVTAGLRVAF